MSFTQHVKQKPSDPVYWTFDDGNEMYDQDFESMTAATEKATEAFLEDLCGVGAGSAQNASVTLVCYFYDGDGERVILQEKEHDLEIDFYHGDFAEHSVWHKGGVL